DFMIDLYKVDYIFFIRSISGAFWFRYYFSVSSSNLQAYVNHHPGVIILILQSCSVSVGLWLSEDCGRKLNIRLERAHVWKKEDEQSCKHMFLPVVTTHTQVEGTSLLIGIFSTKVKAYKTSVTG
ncbi:hypothetical protein ACJX0J_021785, partial [Zea mays]